VRDPTQRFSNRVENYIRFRPRYPGQLLDVLRSNCGFNSHAIVADIGSGTGILTELLLVNGNRVFGVEPNQEMREAGKRLLLSYRGFTSICGTAEATTLPDQSVDFITAGQAFHWFDQGRCRPEFRRILRPHGWVILTWNQRKIDASPFSAAYERLLAKFGTDYTEVKHERIDAPVLREFFQAEPIKVVLPNHQQFDFSALTGRLLSSSYVPEPGQANHIEMLESLRQLFDSHQVNGQVGFEYDTIIYCARLS
jgi:SAM-dependent methyltransferase